MWQVGSWPLRRDRLARRGLPIVWCAALLLHWVLFRYCGSVATAYAASICGVMYALLLLAMLSIPRRIETTFDGLVIHCLLEVTVVDAEQIRFAQRLSRHPKWSVPLAGLWGVGGYYGYWFDLRRWRFFKIYAGSRGPCLRICRKQGCDIITDFPIGWEPRPAGDAVPGTAETETMALGGDPEAPAVGRSVVS